MGEHFILVFIFRIDLFFQISWLERDQIVLFWRSDACAIPFGLCDLLFKNAVILFGFPFNTDTDFLIEFSTEASMKN